MLSKLLTPTRPPLPSALDRLYLRNLGFEDALIDLLPPTFSQSGFLNGKRATVEHIFNDEESRAGGGFTYIECVLNNVGDPLVIRKAALKFLDQVSKRQRANTTVLLDTDLLNQLLSVSKLPNEKAFYLLHQMIESVCAPVFIGLRSLQAHLNGTITIQPDGLKRAMENAANAMEQTCVIMDEFPRYITRDSFNEYRRKLKGASGAQSPLRYIDILIYGRSEKDQKDRHRFETLLDTTFPGFINDTLAPIEHLISNLSPPLKALLHRLIELRIRFKTQHFNIVKSTLMPASQKGTGGSDFNKFLPASVQRDQRLLELLHSE